MKYLRNLGRGAAALFLIGCLAYAGAEKEIAERYQEVNRIYSLSIPELPSDTDTERGLFPIVSISTKIAPINTLMPFTASILTKRGECALFGSVEGSLADDKVVYSVDHIQCGEEKIKMDGSIGPLSRLYEVKDHLFAVAYGNRVDIPLVLTNGENVPSHMVVSREEGLFFVCFDKECRGYFRSVN